jgi:hypothetical protein
MVRRIRCDDDGDLFPPGDFASTTGTDSSIPGTCPTAPRCTPRAGTSSTATTGEPGRERSPLEERRADALARAMSWPAIPSATPPRHRLPEDPLPGPAAQLRDQASAEGRNVAEDWRPKRYGSWRRPPGKPSTRCRSRSTTRGWRSRRAPRSARTGSGAPSQRRGGHRDRLHRDRRAGLRHQGRRAAAREGQHHPGSLPRPGAGVFSTAYVAWLGRAPAVRAGAPFLPSRVPGAPAERWPCRTIPTDGTEPTAVPNFDDGGWEPPRARR